MKTCQQCQSNFEITPADRRFFERFDVPEIKYCFPCRLQRKMLFYNRRRLYKRQCDLTGKSIVSIFSPDKPFKAYNTRDWYSDQWNALDFGRDFDFSRPFFEQFDDLLHAVPHNALAVVGDNINSDFTNDNYNLKNCYLVFDGERAESSYYGETFFLLKDCLDFLFLHESEGCYECIVCAKCYNMKWSRFCQNCSDGWFLKDCVGCRHCFGCVNLRNKEYYVFNEPKSKEDYEAFLAKFDSGDHATVDEMRKKVESFYKTQPVKAVRGTQNENVVGDNLNHCKDAFECFDCNDLRDCRYMTDCLLEAKDCMDVHVWGDHIEQCYNCELIGVNAQRLMSCIYVLFDCSDLYYCYWCTRNVQHCFGCVGLTHKSYCILNKQYSKEDYFALRDRIIDHMKKSGEWGEFFPPEITPFGYNETQAMDYFPLTRLEVLKRGWKWCDFESKIEASRTLPAPRLPENIKDIPDDILNWSIECEVSGKPFKIIPRELKFYRDHRLPIPRRHPDQRHRDRLALKEPYRLYSRNCAKCLAPIQTTYSPERSELVYCAECYLKEVY